MITKQNWFCNNVDNCISVNVQVSTKVVKAKYIATKTPSGDQLASTVKLASRYESRIGVKKSTEPESVIPGIGFKIPIIGEMDASQTINGLYQDLFRRLSDLRQRYFEANVPDQIASNGKSLRENFLAAKQEYLVKLRAAQRLCKTNPEIGKRKISEVRDSISISETNFVIKVVVQAIQRINNPGCEYKFDQLKDQTDRAYIKGQKHVFIIHVSNYDQWKQAMNSIDGIFLLFKEDIENLYTEDSIKEFQKPAETISRETLERREETTLSSSSIMDNLSINPLWEEYRAKPIDLLDDQS